MKLKISKWKVTTKKSYEAETLNPQPFLRYTIVLVRGHNVPPGLDLDRVEGDTAIRVNTSNYTFMFIIRKNVHLRMRNLTFVKQSTFIHNYSQSYF